MQIGARARQQWARRLVLFRGRRRHGDMPDGQLELQGIETCTSGEPVAQAQLEVPSSWPVGHDSNQLGQVQLGVAPLQFRVAGKRQLDGGHAVKTPLRRLRYVLIVATHSCKVRVSCLSRNLGMPASFNARRKTWRSITSMGARGRPQVAATTLRINVQQAMNS